MTDEEIRKLFKEVEDLKNQNNQLKRNMNEVLKLLQKIYVEVQ